VSFPRRKITKNPASASGRRLGTVCRTLTSDTVEYKRAAREVARFYRRVFRGLSSRALFAVFSHAQPRRVVPCLYGVRDNFERDFNRCFLFVFHVDSEMLRPCDREL